MSRAWVPVFGLVVLACFAIVALFPWSLHPDNGFYLHIGELLLDGARPYVDVVDLNPPLIMYLNVPFAAVSRVLGTNPVPTFLALMVVLELASLVAVGRALRGVRGLAADEVAALVAAFACANVFFHYLMTGQREHFFVLAWVPMLIVRWRDYRGEPVGAAFAVAVGAAFGVAASLKPFYVGLQVAAELWFLVAHRNWRATVRPAALAAVGAVGLYALHFAFWPEPCSEAWFGRWLPMTVEHYDAFEDRHLDLSNRMLAIVVGASIAAYVGRGAEHPLRQLLGPLAVAMVPALASVWWQHKGWRHHDIPLQTALVLLVAASALVALRGRLRLVPLVAGVTIGLTAAGVVAGLSNPPTALTSWHDFEEHLLEHTAPGDNVAVISTGTLPTYPVFNRARLVSPTRYIIHFPVAMFYDGVRAPSDDAPFPYRIGDAQPAAERRYLEELGADLAAHPPRIIYVATHTTLALPPGFRLDEYLRATGFTRRSMSGYELAETIPRFEVWRPVGYSAAARESSSE